MYCNVCNEYKKLKKNKISYIFKKKLSLCIVYSVVMNMKKMCKEEESIEILKIIGLIYNIEEYQRIYNHVWRKHKSRI